MVANHCPALLSTGSGLSSLRFGITIKVFPEFTKFFNAIHIAKSLHLMRFGTTAVTKSTAYFLY